MCFNADNPQTFNINEYNKAHKMPDEFIAKNKKQKDTSVKINKRQVCVDLPLKVTVDCCIHIMIVNNYFYVERRDQDVNLLKLFYIIFNII